MKIKDCPLWPCTEDHDAQEYEPTPHDVRRIHAWHQFESMLVGDSRMWLVGTRGIPYRQLIHNGKKPR